MKTCPGCKETKEISEFYKRRGNKPGSYCKSCNRAYQYAWRNRDPEADITRRRVYMRKYIYGLSPKEQDLLPRECAVCGTTENLHLDHDHSTGYFRGVLCRDHNLGIGRFQDDPMLLIRASDYLLRHLSKRGG